MGGGGGGYKGRDLECVVSLFSIVGGESAGRRLITAEAAAASEPNQGQKGGMWGGGLL